MLKKMNNTETKYVKIVNRNNQVNITPIIPRFCTVQRFLTATEIKACLNRGAIVSEIKGDKLFPLSLENYNNIIVETPVVKKEIKVTEEVTKTVVEEPEVTEDFETIEKQSDPYTSEYFEKQYGYTVEDPE